MKKVIVIEDEALVRQGIVLAVDWASVDCAVAGEAANGAEALDLFQLPRTIGTFEGESVVIGAGRFGPYVLHQKQYTSLPKGADPMTITLDEAIRLIQEKRQAESQKHLKSFDAEGKLQILNGRYGPYIAYDGKNYRLPKAQQPRAAELTYDECMAIIEKQKK